MRCRVVKIEYYNAELRFHTPKPTCGIAIGSVSLFAIFRDTTVFWTIFRTRRKGIDCTQLRGTRFGLQEPL